jgi:hypothetical protein
MFDTPLLIMKNGAHFLTPTRPDAVPLVRKA